MGQDIELNNHTIKIIDTDIHSYSWDFSSIERSFGIDITRFRKEALSFEMKVLIDVDIHNTLNRLLELTEIDILNKKAGRLFFNDYYIECYMIASNTKPSEDFGAERTWKVFAPYPFWIKEEVREFYQNTIGDSTGGLDYKLNYSYDYTETTKGVDRWDRNHFAPSHFKIEIFGAVVNPRIVIGSNIYEVNYSINRGETITIDSRKEEIVKRAIDGRETNIFAYRNREYDIFKHIEPNTLKINWSGNFGFTLTIFEERSEPKW